MQADALPGEVAFEAEVRQRIVADQRVNAPCRRLLRAEIGRDQRHQLIAVEKDAALIGDDQPVGIAVESNTDIGAPRQHLLPHMFRHQRATFAVDVKAIGRDADRKTSAPNSWQYSRRDL